MEHKIYKDMKKWMKTWKSKKQYNLQCKNLIKIEVSKVENCKDEQPELKRKKNFFTFSNSN